MSSTSDFERYLNLFRLRLKQLVMARGLAVLAGAALLITVIAVSLAIRRGFPAEIVVTARILAVANAFVGMVSARAHRPGLGFEKAMDILHDQGGTLYDRSVITALAWALEHGGGSEDWAHFLDR